MKAKKAETFGKVVQVIGPVVDVEFDEAHLPAIFNAIRLVSEGFDVPDPIDIIVEAQQHLGEGRIRTVALKPTDGLVRGMKAIDTGAPITVPVGKATLGRIMNVLGEPVTSWARSTPRRPMRFTALRLRSKTRPLRRRCSRRASRSLTCCNPSSKAARPGCSAAPG